MAQRLTKKAHSLVVAESEIMKGVVRKIDELAASNLPVLIVGEPGTGRELVARVLHTSSKRKKGPFVTVNGAALPKTLFAERVECTSPSILREAKNGTVLIKNMTELARSVQRKLVRILRDSCGPAKDEKPSVRFICSADNDLDFAVQAQVFNSDLYSLLKENMIVVPPLRERLEDIPILIQNHIRIYAKQYGRSFSRVRNGESIKQKMTISKRAEQRLFSYPWPGNVAELKGVARRLVLRAKKSRIDASEVDELLPSLAEKIPFEEMGFEEVVRAKIASVLRRMDGYPVSNLHEDVLARVEKPLLELVMAHTGSNQLQTAEILGLNRNTLRRKLSDYKMTPMRTKSSAARRRNAKVAK